VRPTIVRYEAPGFGVGALWLDGDRVVWSELPRPVRTGALSTGPGPVTNRPQAEGGFAAATRPATAREGVTTPVTGPGPVTDRPQAAAGLARRLAAFFAGAADDFADVELDLDDGFYGACERALRGVPRGEVVTYGELAALAGRPGAARAAGTFCARNRLAPFVPCHRVVAANGIGGYGSLGLDYKRRLLALERVVL
jgi:O-6-methylguanine DNA methyltransferase